MSEGIKDYKAYNRLAQALNHTFGTTGPGAAKISTQHVSFTMVNETQLRANFHMIVTIGSVGALEKARQKFEKEAIVMVEAGLKNAIENYKALFPEEKAVKFKLDTATVTDHIDFVQNRQLSGVQRGYYVMKCLVDVS